MPGTLDCLVVGAGPAGLVAATYLARFRRRIAVVDAGASRARWIPTSHNCPGFPLGVSGTTLLARLREQAEEHGVVVTPGRIDWLLQRERADVVVLETGANDGLRALPVDATRSNIQQILRRVRAALPQARVVLVQMEAPPNLGARYTSAFSAMYPSLAREEGCHRFDIRQERRDPALFLLIEIYQDDEALQIHRESEHYLAFRADVQDWVVDRQWWFWEEPVEARVEAILRATRPDLPMPVQAMRPLAWNRASTAWLKLSPNAPDRAFSASASTPSTRRPTAMASKAVIGCPNAAPGACRSA